MKKQITFLFLIMFVLSCSKKPTSDEIARRNIEEYLLPSLNDPESYEFVNMSPLDTIFVIESAKNSLTEYEKMLKEMKDYPDRIKKQEDFADKFDKHKGYEKDAAEARANAKKFRELYAEVEGKIAEKKSEITATKPDEISEINTKFKFRATNKMGGKILASYYVALTDSLTVKYMDKE